MAIDKGLIIQTFSLISLFLAVRSFNDLSLTFLQTFALCPLIMAETVKHLLLKVKSYNQKIHEIFSILDFKDNHAIPSNQSLTITTAGSLSNGKANFPVNLHKIL